MPLTLKENDTSAVAIFMLLLFGPAVVGAIIGGTAADPATANWGFWMGLAVGAALTATLIYLNLLKVAPRTGKAGGVIPAILLALCVGLGMSLGYFIAGLLGAGIGLIVGLAVMAIVGYLLDRLVGDYIKRRPAAERAVSEAITEALRTMLLWPAFFALIFAISNEKIRDAVYSAVDQVRIEFWTYITIGVVIGLVSGVRTIRATLRKVSSESAAPFWPVTAAPQKGESNRHDTTSTGISEKPQSRNP